MGAGGNEGPGIARAGAACAAGECAMNTTARPRFLSALLFRISELIAPPGSQAWIAAMRAESQVVSPGSSQLRWAVGGVITAVRANLVEGGGWLFVSALSLGVAVSYVDLRSVSRLALQVLLLASAFSIGLWGPSRAMIAVPALIAGRALLVVALGFPEPYSHDQMDVLYCAAPAGVGMCTGLALRSLLRRLQSRE